LVNVPEFVLKIPSVEQFTQSEESMREQFPSSSERRSFLTRFSAGFTALAATVVAGRATAQAQSPTAARWQPARYEKDDWLDKIPGKHRMVFDTTKIEGFGEAIAFANNYLRTSRSDYALQNTDMAILIIARSRSTQFAYNNAMWAKYGTVLSRRADFTDPKTKQPAIINPYSSEELAELLPSRGTTLDALLKQGVQLGVCQVATRGIATAIAGSGGNVDAIYNELTSNLAANARMVPAGIITVNRAQERGYSLVTA
jgi:hypothetical protein